MSLLQGTKGKVADLLFQVGAIKIDTVKGFRLKLHEKNPGVAFELFVDLPDAGEPFGDQIERITAEWIPRPGRLRLTKTITDGSRHINPEVGGDYTSGESRVLVVDELITKADSKFEGIDAMEGVGLVVEYVLVLVDREQGGRAQLESKDYKLLAAFTLTELLDHLAARGFISLEDFNTVQDYLAANS